MKAKNNFSAFFISLSWREVRNLSAKSASGKLQFQLPGLLQHRQNYLENTKVRPTGTTFGHWLLPPAQSKLESCLQEFVPQRDSSPPTKWPTATKVSDFWMNSNVFLKKTWLGEFLIWRVQEMGELTTWAELLQLLMTPGFGWISVPLPGR